MSAIRDRMWLLANLPHQGEMNLLREVVAWDATSLRAHASSHRSPTQPLRRDGTLPIAAAIEYGAQAAAAHGALATGMPSGAGFLASVRGVRFHAQRLDDVDADLEIEATQVGSGAGGVLYAFRVAAGPRLLAEGRVAVAFVAR